MERTGDRRTPEVLPREGKRTQEAIEHRRGITSNPSLPHVVDVDYPDYSDIILDPDPAHPAEFDIESFLEESQRRAIDRLETELDRIDHQLNRRDEIHVEAVEELESKLEWYMDQLEELRRRPTTEREKRRELKARIREFYSDLRTERRSHWQDLQDLERERRTLRRELAELDEGNLITDFL